MSDIDDIIMGGMVFKGGGGPKKIILLYHKYMFRPCAV